MTEGDNPQGGAGEIPGLAALLGADGPLASFGELLRSARADLSERVVEGSAGGGAVRVTMTGERRLTWPGWATFGACRQRLPLPRL